jgi:hypothetical protein
MANLSGTVDLQSAEHLYTLRELMEIFKLGWCSFLRDQTQGYLNDIEVKRQQAVKGGIPAILDADDLKHQLEALRDVEKFCAEVGWSNAERTIHDLRFELEEFVVDVDYAMMAITFRACLRVLGRELEDRVFLYVSPEDVELYNEPLEVFSKVLIAFGSAKGDVIEACRCYALNRYTACVFHCMGILQYGLFALANDIKAELTVPLQMAEWCKVINSIEGKIKDLRNERKSPEKDDKLAFYSECGVQFRYFKDAWRNHVAHLREEYDKDQAHSVLIHTREFMEHLSKRVGEVPVPPMEI